MNSKPDLSNYSNYRRNQYGGIDCDRLLSNGEVVPCTLTDAEVNEVADFIADFDSSKITSIKAAAVRAERDKRINEIVWRYERHAREMRLGVPATDSLEQIDAYIQALADITEQSGFPDLIVWPEL